MRWTNYDWLLVRGLYGVFQDRLGGVWPELDLVAGRTRLAAAVFRVQLYDAPYYHLLDPRDI